MVILMDSIESMDWVFTFEQLNTTKAVLVNSALSTYSQLSSLSMTQKRILISFSHFKSTKPKPVDRSSSIYYYSSQVPRLLRRNRYKQPTCWKQTCGLTRKKKGARALQDVFLFIY
ncbi:hypothetical protein T06_15743 [Trichinella sp. T6]|nr:hypothetical protein T06_15743 [Trichinella sp. T6]